METIIVHPKTKELKIDFTSEKSPYNPEFVKKILKAKQAIKDGKGLKIDVNNLWK